MVIENPRRDNLCPLSVKYRVSISTFTRSFFYSSLFFLSPASLPTGKFTINNDCLREHRLQAAVRSDERSRYRDHRVEPRPSSVAKSSVDAVSNDELFAIKRDATTWRSDEQRWNCYEGVLVGGALESRVLDKSGGSGSYGVALKPTYRLFFLWRNPPVNGSVL